MRRMVGRLDREEYLGMEYGTGIKKIALSENMIINGM